MQDIDKLSFLIAAACHDLGHDGFTNNYHVNAITHRAIDCNDSSAQENFHAAQTFRILAKKECDFLGLLSRAEFLHFRKRVIGLILATDMTKHAAMITSMKQLIAVN